MSDTPKRSEAIRATLKATAKADKRFVPYVIGAFLLGFGGLLAVGFVIDHPIILGILGFFVGVTLALVVTGRRASKAAFSQVEGQVGAAYAVLNAMRGHWRITPAVGVTRTQELVHRVIGRQGVILVGEGASAARVRELLNGELRRHRRVLGETPLHDIVVGEGEGQVPLRRLQAHLMKLPRAVEPRVVNELDTKLKALAAGPTIPLPKGPMPRGGRMPRGKQR